MRPTWRALAVVLFASSLAQAQEAAVKVLFERQDGQAVDWTPAAPVKKTLGIAWDERARSDGKTAVFARSVTLTYSIAPGLSLSQAGRRAMTRELEAALRQGLPTQERPALVKADEEAVSDYRRAAADRLMRVVESTKLQLASSTPLEFPAQAVVVAP